MRWEVVWEELAMGVGREEGRGRGGGGWWGWTIAVCHLRLLAGSVLCAGSGHRRREITTVWDDDHEQNDERRFRDHIIGGRGERERERERKRERMCVYVRSECMFVCV